MSGLAGRCRPAEAPGPCSSPAIGFASIAASDTVLDQPRSAALCPESRTAAKKGECGWGEFGRYELRTMATRCATGIPSQVTVSAVDRYLVTSAIASNRPISNPAGNATPLQTWHHSAKAMEMDDLMNQTQQWAKFKPLRHHGTFKVRHLDLDDLFSHSVLDTHSTADACEAIDLQQYIKNQRDDACLCRGYADSSTRSTTVPLGIKTKERLPIWDPTVHEPQHTLPRDWNREMFDPTPTPFKRHNTNQPTNILLTEPPLLEEHPTSNRTI
ncbi:hypothetical protein HYFRA_00013781 [Hymenoscyphus fraxineus]|uniref:Uncharacterized protein n=1 Tax=Hymenoscyphus fraxineus TaxID=746836 RepID=A0A9N9LBR6_9HELO|nr:hypothetical protein HYFRA_00013781 [Hymenoscyphus fraxineus]